MCIFYVLCVGCSARSVVLCAVLIYQTIFLYTGVVVLRKPQRQTDKELDKPITQEEITKAIAKLKPTGPGFSGAHAACFKAIWAEGGEAAGLLKDCIMTIWEQEKLPEFWLDALLKMLSALAWQTQWVCCCG